MKKIFTLLCAAVVALSASAASVELARRADKKQILAEMKVPARQVGGEFFKTPAVKRAISGTPVGVTQAQVQFYQEIWYLDCADANNNLLAEFAFYNGKDDQIAGQYIADGQNAMVIVVPAAGDTVTAKGSFSIAYVEQGAQYPKYHVVASGLKDSLNREFDFDFTAEIFAFDYEKYYYATNYPDYCGYFVDCDYVIELDDAPVVLTGDTIRHAIELPADLADFTSGDRYGDKWFQFIANDEAYQVSICVNSDHLIGSFTAEDVDAQYTGAYDLSAGSAVQIKIDTITDVLVSQSGDTLIAFMQFIGRDGIVYEFTVKNFTPQVIEEKTSELWGMQVDDTYLSQYGSIDFGAYNTTDTIVLSVYVQSGITGNYTADNIDPSYSYIIVGKVVAKPVHEATFSIVSAGDGYVLRGDFLAKDGVLYHITMHTGWPEAIENTEVEVKAAIKKFENGALIIEKNGVKYNAQGAILK